MKTKLFLLGITLMAVSASLIVSSATFAQMGGNSSKGNSVGASSGPGEAKPGTVLQGGIIVATPITKEEAAKKYPAPKGGYPIGDRPYTHTPNHILSPYPPHSEMDCSNIAHGGLVLDTHTNKVFVRP
jgi:hypothetical protein